MYHQFRISCEARSPPDGEFFSRSRRPQIVTEGWRSRYSHIARSDNARRRRRHTSDCARAVSEKTLISDLFVGRDQSMSNLAFVAHSAFWTVDERVIEKVKLATLLFDTIRWSVPDPLTFAHVTTSEHSEPSLSNYAESELEECWHGHSADLPPYSIYGPDEGVLRPKESPELFAAIKSALVASGLDPDKQYDDYKLAIYTMSEIIYWSSNLPSATFIGHDISDQSLHSYATTIAEKHPLREVACPSPNLFDLPWNDIVSLRKSPYLKAFRAKYVELCTSGNVQELFERYQNALECLCDEVRPRIGETVAMGVLSNLPIPFIGVPATIGAVATEKRLQKEFGWAFFVREARKLKM
jgi:hypothetical protein